MLGRRILYIGNYLLPDGDAASHRVLGNAKILKHIGHEVYLLGCKKDIEKIVFETAEDIKGFPSYFFSEPTSMASWLKYLLQIKWYIPLIQKINPTDIIAYNYPGIALERLRRYCKKKNINLYSDCTEWYQPQGNFIYRIIKDLDTFYRMRIVHKRLSGIICISSYLVSFYKNMGVKTICLPPLVDKNDEKWNNSYIDNDGVVLSYVGNPGSGRKDKLDLIVSTLNKIKEREKKIKFKLIVVGINKEDCERIFSVKPNENVIFLGKIPNIEALDVVKKSDFSIFLREKNLVTTAGFPTKFSESLSCGTPVLTNNTSDITRYLKNGENGYLLKIDREQELYKSLFSILSLEREQILKMKNYCVLNNYFDYRLFVEEIKKMF